MRHLVLGMGLIWISLVSVTGVQSGGEKEFPLVEAVECRPRSGLPNFFEKVKTPGTSLKVGYLGGSITAQPGWRVKTLEHFQKTWPEAKFSEINAAIGGTGSDFGVYRVEQDVLRHRPDLLFVEFAVNDGRTDPQQIQRAMEGIVRQTWKALPECDLCFVYTITEELAPPLLKGHFQRSASAMESVADHYAIPTIHLGMEVAKLAREEKLLWKAPLSNTDDARKNLAGKFVFASDGVHPYVETGHELYLQAIVRALEPIRQASTHSGAHRLGMPLDPKNFEQARLIPLTADLLSDEFVSLDMAQDSVAKWFGDRLTSLYKSQQPGSKLSFRFKGDRCALLHVVGPDVGMVKVTLDGVSSERPLFDPYCSSYRLNTLQVTDESTPNAVHEVEIELLAKAPDKTRILAIIQAAMDKPERFEGLNFYPGAILLVGEVLSP